MAHRYPANTWADGDTLTPHELMAELAELAGESNGGIDRDNIGGAVITGAKVAVDVFNRLDLDAASPGSGGPTVGKTSGSGLEWTSIASLEVEAVDGMLDLTGFVSWFTTVAPGSSAAVLIGLMVDGNLEASSGWDYIASAWDTACVDALVPVGAGLHRVDLVVSVAILLSLASYTVRAEHYSIVARGVRR